MPRTAVGHLVLAASTMTAASALANPGPALQGLAADAFSPPACGGASLFADVDPDDPFCPWIKQAFLDDLTEGCASSPSGRFCPKATLTREQLAVLLGKVHHAPAGGALTGNYPNPNLVAALRLPTGCPDGSSPVWGGSLWLCGSSADAWSLTGNANTNPGTHFVGTSDGQNLEIRAGAVGVGTITPARKLHVASSTAGLFRAESLSNAVNPVVELKDASPGQQRIGAINFLDAANGVPGQVAYHMASDEMTFRTASATRLTINGVGNLEASGEYFYSSPRTRILAVPAAAFTPIGATDSGEFFLEDSFMSLIDVSLAAPIQLPAESQITHAACLVKDDDNPIALSMELRSFSGGSLGTQGTVGASPNALWIEFDVDPPFHVAETEWVHLRLELEACLGCSCPEGACLLYGCHITYVENRVR